MQVSVIGSGRWGTFLAWYLAQEGRHEVTLYGREGSARMRRLAREGRNEWLALPAGVALTCDLAQALAPQVVLVSVPSQNLRGLLRQCGRAAARGRLFVLCMKGLEAGGGKRLSEVFGEEMGDAARCAVWLGPGHVQEFVRGVPNCMVVDAPRAEDKRFLIEAFSSDLIRFYYGEDLIGNEVGAAAKNVVGIAAGMLDAFGLGSLKGALMSRGCREYARLMAALGGQERSAYGLCHLGDYEATVFSAHSHNRAFGESFARGKPYTALAEGYYTVAALTALADKTGVELPISQALHAVLYGGKPPREALDGLFARSLKQEFA